MKKEPPLQKLIDSTLRLYEKERAFNKEKNMEALKSLFSSKTNHGRVIRTFLQAFVGLSTLMLGVFAIPEFYTLFDSLPLIAQLGGMAAFVGIISAVQNYGTKFLDYIKEW